MLSLIFFFFFLSSKLDVELKFIFSLKGTAHPCPFLESLSTKVGSMLCRCSSPNKYKRLDAKLERKLVEAKKGSSGHHNFKSINSIILKFPQFKDGLKCIRAVFEQYGKTRFDLPAPKLSPSQVAIIKVYSKVTLSLSLS